MFHAVPGMMEPGQAYDTAAGPDAGQLTIGEEGDTVTGPCNSANVAMTVDVCGSVVHVVAAVLLPASFCEGDEAAASEEDDEDKDDHDHEDHDHDHDDDDDDDVEAVVDAEFAAQDDDETAAPAAPVNPGQQAFSEAGVTVDQQLQSQLSGGLVSDSDEQLFDIMNNDNGNAAAAAASHPAGASASAAPRLGSPPV